MWAELDKEHLSHLRKHSQDVLSSLAHPKVEAQFLQEITAHSQQLISTFPPVNGALWTGTFHKVTHSAWNLPRICNSEGINWITSWRLFSSTV